MSVKIEQIAEVIEEIKEAFRANPSDTSVYSRRLQATKSIAAQRGIEKTTVNDKFIRGLRPHISSLHDFDRLYRDWQNDKSPELKAILLKHATSSSDRERIENALYIAPEPDVLLAQEFGFDPNEQSFREGKEQFRLHRDKERNRNLVNRAKETWMAASHGNISCSACGFSFSKTYGELGAGFIEAHHKIPIATLTPDTIVSVADLLPVCSNCHSMLHRKHQPWLTVEQLKELVGRQQIKFANGAAHGTNS
ncbi:MAG: HNH endonuclease [Thermodesulfobacteriota bacterium]|jgi:predicted HNH restriction endonuclease|nr:MAG: HNH endonuclease [Thermodesulfobacteriota bacterium]